MHAYFNVFLCVTIAVEKKRRLSQIELTKMALKKVESDSEEERVSILNVVIKYCFIEDHAFH